MRYNLLTCDAKQQNKQPLLMEKALPSISQANLGQFNGNADNF